MVRGYYSMIFIIKFKARKLLKAFNKELLIIKLISYNKSTTKLPKCTLVILDAETMAINANFILKFQKLIILDLT